MKPISIGDIVLVNMGGFVGRAGSIYCGEIISQWPTLMLRTESKRSSHKQIEIALERNFDKLKVLSDEEAMLFKLENA
jgi:small ligand-binding sensory domain FIST